MNTLLHKFLFTHLSLIISLWWFPSRRNRLDEPFNGPWPKLSVLCIRIPFSPHAHQHWVLSLFNLLVKCYDTVCCVILNSRGTIHTHDSIIWLWETLKNRKNILVNPMPVKIKHWFSRNAVLLCLTVAFDTNLQLGNKAVPWPVQLCRAGEPKGRQTLTGVVPNNLLLHAVPLD